MDARDAKRLVAFMVVVFGILMGVAIVAEVDSGNNPGAMMNPEFASDRLIGDPLPRGGGIVPDVPPDHQLGTIVIDTGHRNQLDRETIGPLVRGITTGNNQVRFHREDDDLAQQLQGAKAYVIVSPGMNYSKVELSTISRFRSQGGRVLLVGEPDQYRSTGFGVVRQSDVLTEVASSLDVSFDTGYLYNLETNEGTYKQVPVMPAQNSPLQGSGSMTVFTGTRVTAPYGTDVLVTATGTQLSDGRGPGQFPVAKRVGNVIAVGDRTMLSANYHNVGQNEEFLEYLVEFLSRGEVAFNP